MNINYNDNNKREMSFEEGLMAVNHAPNATYNVH